ncbi:MAG: fructosamine kinase family protein [Planctomycetota bacterium]
MIRNEPQPANPQRGAAISLALATQIARRYIAPGLTVTGSRKLYGGSINRVVEWTTDGEPKSVVAKLNNSRNVRAFEREMVSLRTYREHTTLPVPRPLAVLSDEPGFDGSGLLMEKIPGITLADAKVSVRGFARLQHQLARFLVDLHSHHRSTYGSALEDRGVPRWLDNFGPVIEKEFHHVREFLSSGSRWFIDDLIQNLEDWLPEQSTPTLVHGDLWANNIMVSDAHPDEPDILAFIDGLASYCDPEYELAYLRMFQTADDSFFEMYRRRHPLRPGFSRRCRVYWLNTMMMHIRVFGERYIASCEQLAQQLKSLAKS